MGGRGSGGAVASISKLNVRKAFRDSLQRTDKVRREMQNKTTDEFRQIITQRRKETSGVGKEHYEFLKKYAKSKGWKVIEKPIVEGRETANGYARAAEGIIEIKSGLNISNKAKTMAHEIFHMSKHSPKSGRSKTVIDSRARKEMEAETFADMAMQKMGGKSPSSPYYVEGWRLRENVSTNYLGKEAKPHLQEVFKDMFPD